jgi:hypothetical protein
VRITRDANVCYVKNAESGDVTADGACTATGLWRIRFVVLWIMTNLITNKLTLWS